LSNRKFSILILVCGVLVSCGPSQKEVRETEAEALAVLMDLLDDSSVGPEYLGEAAQVLGHLKPAGAIPNIVKLLAHPNEFVAFKAIGALGRIGDERSVASLLDLFEETQSQILKVEVARVLAEKGDQEKRNWLLGTLRGGALGIFRSNAATALSRLGDKEAIPSLRVAFEKDPVAIVRSGAALALARLDDTGSLKAIADTLAQTPQESTALVMVEALEIFGNPAAIQNLESAVMRSDWSFSLRRRCLLAIARLGSNVSIGNYLQDLLVNSKEVPDQMLAAEGLGLIGDAAAVPKLWNAFQGYQNHPLRLGAAGALARLGDVGNLAIELEDDLASTEEGFQLQAAEVLGILGDTRSVGVLQTAAENSINPTVRQAAVQALAKMQDDFGVRALVDIFENSETMGAKQGTIEALGIIRSGGSRDALLGLLKKTEYATLKIGCLRELSRFRDSELIRVFRPYFRDHSLGVRLQAAAGVFYISQQIPVESAFR
jgi:HEAT repeat protein